MAFQYVPPAATGQPQTVDYSGLIPEQQQQQPGVNPLQGLQMYQQFSGADGGGMFGFGGGGSAAAPGGAGSAGAGAGGAGGGAGGSGAGAGMGAVGWAAALAALIGAKAEHTRKTSDVGWEEQAKNISLAPQKDFDHWGLDKYAPLGGGDVYKSTFDLATFDLSNWWKGATAPFREIF